MNRRTNLNLIRLLVAAVVIGMLLTSTVSAQKVTVSISKQSTTGIRPEILPGSISFRVEYSLDNQQLLLTPTSSSVPVTFKATCPAGIIVTGPASTLIPIAQPPTPGTPYFATGDFQVSLTRSVPGLQTLKCTMVADVGQLGTANPAIADPDGVSQEFNVVGAYYGLIQTKVATKLKQAAPYKQVPFEIEVTNFGNARTQVAFSILNAPTGSKWDALLPDNLILASPAVGDGKTSDIATFTVSTPYKTGWNNVQGSYQLLLKASASDDPTSVASDVNANVLVRVRGVYVPGFEPLFLLGAVMGTAMLIRRKNE